MQSYIELTLIKDSEISPYFIWSKLYTQLHLAFVEQKDAQGQIVYGVSFPEYCADRKQGKGGLGSKLRVFAPTVQVLEALNLDKWLDRLSDYVHTKTARPVPNVKGHLCVSRQRPQPSPGNLARRYATRKGVALDAAMQRLQGYTQTMADLPYIQVKSLSGGQNFTLCIEQRVVDAAVEGRFSTYGLSATTTVPHW